MRVKCFIPILILFLVHFSNCKPSTKYLTEGRGIGSTIWGWVTYPFSWWSSSAPEQTPINEQLVGPASYGPYDNIEIAKRNVTVWCNDQTCTTMKCDKLGCKNQTCNIYDTDMKGECREYNTELKPEEPTPPKPTQSVTDPTLQDKVTVSTASTTTTTTSAQATNEPPPQVEERPLELEAVLSSTVTEHNPDKLSPDAKANKSSSPKNKV